MMNLISIPPCDAGSAPACPENAWIYQPTKPWTGPEAAVLAPLAGLTFAVKDNVDVIGWTTTAACPAFAFQPADSAQVVHRLLSAGAVLAGKTNLDQFACGLSGTRSPYGAVPNAFDPAYVSGGSSSGSAYVVASGQVDFALGTDTAGSGRIPAGLNNIVGLKPSRGLISTRGVLPAAQSVDCVSIFARSVATAVKVLESAMGHDPLDAYSRLVPMAPQAFPASFRFGLPSELEFFGDDSAEAAFNEAVQRMQSLGGTPVAVDFTPFRKIADLLYGSALVAERYAAIRQFFDAQEAKVLEPVRSIIAAGRNYSAADLFDAQTQLRLLAQQTAPLWEGVELLLVPTAPTHYTVSAMQQNPVELNRRLGAYTNFVNLLDYAALSVPSSLRPDGLPFGVTLVGRVGSDWQLAELGQRYHHATGLLQGATRLPLPAPQPIAGLHADTTAVPTVRVAVVGAHLSGMPLNSQLTERGATFLGDAHTTADYRLYALPGTTPPKPGLQRVAPGLGARIALEIWEMPVAHYGSFVALIPAPLGIGTVQLEGGAGVQGFLCESLALQGAQDITRLGGWRAYMTQQQAAMALAATSPV